MYIDKLRQRNIGLRERNIFVALIFCSRFENAYFCE